MAGFKIAEVTTDAAGKQEVNLRAGAAVAAVVLPIGVSIAVALVGAIQPILADHWSYKEKAQAEATKLEIEKAKYDHERLELSAELFKVSLASNDLASRINSIRLLAKAGYVDARLLDIKPEETPHWPAAPSPAATGTSPEVKK